MKLLFASILLATTLGACSFEAQQCCDCMATKSTLFGDCMTETSNQCVQGLSQNPPNTSVISGACYGENGGYCEESCANILYKK